MSEPVRINVTLPQPLNVKVNVGQSGIQDIIEGSNITIDKTDPRKPIINATGGGTITLDNTVTQASQNGVKSSGIWSFVTELVNSVWNWIFNVAEITYEPTGIYSNDIYNQTIPISFNASTMRATLTGYWAGYLKGNKVIEVEEGVNWVSPQLTLLPNVKGYFLVYSCEDEEFKWVQTNGFDFRCIMLLFVYFRANGTFLFAIREPHAFMPWQSHAADHANVGTVRVSGGDVSGIVLNNNTPSNRRPLVSDTLLRDEDIRTLVPALSTRSYTTAWLQGPAATSEWEQAEIVRLSINNLPQFNVFDGTNWGLQELSSNNFMSVWLIAMPIADDPDSQRYRYIWWTGQAQTTTLEAQLSRSFRDLNLLDFTNIAPEFVPIAQVVVRRIGSNWQIAAVQSITGSRAQQLSTPTGAYLSSVSVTGNITGAGVPTDPINTVPSPTFTDALINQLDSVDNGGVIPNVQFSFLGATSKSVRSFIEKLVGIVYSHETPIVDITLTQAASALDIDLGAHYRNIEFIMYWSGDEVAGTTQTAIIRINNIQNNVYNQVSTGNGNGWSIALGRWFIGHLYMRLSSYRNCVGGLLSTQYYTSEAGASAGTQRNLSTGPDSGFADGIRYISISGSGANSYGAGTRIIVKKA